jgi:hypothetical protein
MRYLGRYLARSKGEAEPMSDDASIPPSAESVDLERALAAQRQHLGDRDPATLSTLQVDGTSYGRRRSRRAGTT